MDIKYLKKMLTVILGVKVRFYKGVWDFRANNPQIKFINDQKELLDGIALSWNETLKIKYKNKEFWVKVYIVISKSIFFKYFALPLVGFAIFYDYYNNFEGVKWLMGLILKFVDSKIG